MDFIVSPTDVVVRYRSEQPGNGWVWGELRTHGSVTFGRTFTFEKSDLVTEPDADFDQDDFETFTYEFLFATRREGYFRIDRRIFDIDNDVLITDEISLVRKVFVAERNISIFRRIAALLPEGQPIIIGGLQEPNIPVPAFNELLKRFPNTGELNRYAAARIDSIVGDYFENMKSAKEEYERYLSRTRSLIKGEALSQPELIELELEKYVLIRNTIASWLTEESGRSEADWQKMIISFLLLIFPKYVAVLGNVQIVDSYPPPGTSGRRFIDLALVDAAGNIDVIEVKKPFANAVLSRRTYRDNSIPAKELAGSIMQAEKYLFHLSKWGAAGEKVLTTRYATKLPTGMKIQITSPKAMIIIGRDCLPDGKAALTPAQSLDLEIIKRKYANMMDIMTYDDLLRRLDNIIEALRRRSAQITIGNPGGDPAIVVPV